MPELLDFTFECTNCHARAPSIKLLKPHSCEVGSVKLPDFRCLYCEKDFRTNAYRNEHYKRVHKTEPRVTSFIVDSPRPSGSKQKTIGHFLTPKSDSDDFVLPRLLPTPRPANPGMAGCSNTLTQAEHELTLTAIEQCVMQGREFDISTIQEEIHRETSLLRTSPALADSVRKSIVSELSSSLPFTPTAKLPGKIKSALVLVDSALSARVTTLSSIDSSFSLPTAHVEDSVRALRNSFEELREQIATINRSVEQLSTNIERSTLDASIVECMIASASRASSHVSGSWPPRENLLSSSPVPTRPPSPICRPEKPYQFDHQVSGLFLNKDLDASSSSLYSFTPDDDFSFNKSFIRSFENTAATDGILEAWNDMDLQPQAVSDPLHPSVGVSIDSIHSEILIDAIPNPPINEADISHYTDRFNEDPIVPPSPFRDPVESIPTVLDPDEFCIDDEWPPRQVASAFQTKWRDAFSACANAADLDKLISDFSRLLTRGPPNRQARQANSAPSSGPNNGNVTVRHPRRRNARGRNFQNNTDPNTTVPVPPLGPPRATATGGTFFNAHGRAFNRQDASDIQKRFNTNEGRTVEEVLSGSRKLCGIPKSDIESYFKKTYMKKTWDRTFHFEAFPAPVGEDLLLDIFDNKIVWQKLCSMKNTAPGPDGVTYNILKQMDKGAIILTALYNKCLTLSHIPAGWRTSNVILAFKSGDPDDICNWRPIALINTICKVLTALLASRLNLWANLNDCLSPNQKGFRENEGCAEHTFLVREIMDDAKRRGVTVNMAWLDLENAFGAVPHTFILGALRAMHVPPAILALITSLYTDSSCAIRTSAGWTDPITMEAGVRQGCPLSAILFNLTMEHIIRKVIRSQARGYRLVGREYKLLAYADDILLVAASDEDLSMMLNTISWAASSAALKFKPLKCASLALSYKRGGPLARRAFFKIQGQRIKAMCDNDAYKYLGLKIGAFYHDDYADKINEIMENCKSIEASLLAPWQMLTALRGHVLPKLDYLLRNLILQKKDVTALDKLVVRTAKSIMNLPQRADANIVHLSCKRGGAALNSCADLVDINTVTYAHRMLTSPDESTREVARASLEYVVKKKTQTTPTPELIARYLSGDKSGVFARDPGGFANTWSKARVATTRLNNRFGLWWEHCPATNQLFLKIKIADATVSVAEIARARTFRLLKEALEQFYINKIKIKPDQGKTIECIAAHPAASHFIKDGRYTRFCDWRFIHRARTGVLNLNATKRFTTNNNRKCRKCPMLETIPHVLNHCKSHSASWQNRHNELQNRIVRAIPGRAGTVEVNKAFPGSSLRPDIVLTRPDGEKYIVDVTVAFEDRPAAFERARARKHAKYDPLAAMVSESGTKCFVGAIVVGSLGSWDPKNDHVVKRLGISHKYATLMRKLICSSSIAWSRDIYVEHVTGKRQYTASRV